MPKNKDPLETRRRFSMGLQLKSIKRRLEKYADDPRIQADPDAYVKGQLEKHNRGGYFYPGIAKDTMGGAVTSGEAIRGNPDWRAFMARPENQATYNLMKEKKGEPFVSQTPTMRPDQEEYSRRMVELAAQKADQIYPKIGQPVPLETPINDMMMNMLQQYQQQHAGRDYMSGGFQNTFPGLQQNLQGLGQGAGQLGQGLYQGGQSAYQAASPYIQAGLQKGGQAARSGLNQAQSYLSAAQPYAQKAANMGGDALNYIRSSATQAGNQGLQGIGNLLGLLKGRV